jgi:hypothetical protein
MPKMKTTNSIITALTLLFVFAANSTYAQKKKSPQPLEYSLTSGYHTVTIPGASIKGFFVQNTISWHPEPIVTISFSTNLSKGSNYPKGKFEAPVREFIVWRDTIGGDAQAIYDMIKDKSFAEVNSFRLTQTSNLYLMLDADAAIINKKNYYLSMGAGLNLIYTQSNDLVLGEVNFSGGRLYSYKPLTVVNKELVYGFNIHIRFQRRLFQDFFAGLYLDRISNDLGKRGGRYPKSEAVNIGLSLSKRFTLNKKP